MLTADHYPLKGHQASRNRATQQKAREAVTSRGSSNVEENCEQRFERERVQASWHLRPPTQNALRN